MHWFDAAGAKASSGHGNYESLEVFYDFGTRQYSWRTIIYQRFELDTH